MLCKCITWTHFLPHNPQNFDPKRYFFVADVQSKLQLELDDLQSTYPIVQGK